MLGLQSSGGAASSEEIHKRIESMKLAYADLRYVADTRVVKVPTEGLIAKPHAAQRAKLIKKDAANCAVEAGVRMLPHEIQPAIIRNNVFVDCTDSPQTAAFYPQLLSAGVHVVSANKRPLGGALSAYRAIKSDRRRGRGVLFHETTVGAALPVVSTLMDLVRTGDRVRRIEGALSGTLGFLMTRLGEGIAFSDALKEAHGLGYTEPNPREDLSGGDVGRKILILAREAGLEERRAVEVERVLGDY